MGETSLAVRQVTPNVWNMMLSMGPVMHNARIFKTGSEAQATAIMLKGYELGLSLTASFEFIDVVEGRPSLSPRGMLALIHQSGEIEKLEITEVKDSCTVHMKRKNGFEHTITWTMEDARKAGVVKDGSGWTKYPANMLRWRAIGFCADVVCPDLLGGLKRADELGANIDSQGNVIQGASWEVLPPQTEQEPSITLETLVNEFGAEAVMEAHGETSIPERIEQFAAIQEKIMASKAAAKATGE